MTDRRIVTPADVPTALVDAAERAINIATTGDPNTEPTLREAIRAILATVLPAYELRLGSELGKWTLPCPTHHAPIVSTLCPDCARYTALLGARRLLEGRDPYGSIFPRSALREADDGTG